MRIPDDVEPDTPQADERLIEFIERRREEQARDRRQRLHLVVIACLGVIGLLLTVSNAVLVNRLLARPSVLPAAAPLPPVRAAVPATATAPPPEPVVEPTASPPAPSEPAEPTTLPQRPVPQAAPPEPAEPTTIRQRPVQQATPPPRSATPRRPVTAEADSARRTARWLVETYGPLEAEGRALAAAQFYSGEDRQFWRRVAAYAQQRPAR